MPKIVDREAKRKSLARAAAMSIAEYGLGTVTLAHIARRAQCTTGTLGYYFDGKDDIVRSALRVTFDRLDERLATAGNDFVSILHEILPVDETRHLECRMWVNFWAHASYSEPLRTLNQELSEAWRSLVERGLRKSMPNLDALPQGRIDMIAAMTTSFLYGVIVQAVTEPSKFDIGHIDRMLESYLETVRSAL